MMEDLLTSPSIAWRERAACLSYPALLFFGMDDAESAVERRNREEQAKRVCDECEVRQACLDYALAAREQYGIWGGLTEIERRGHLRGRNIGAR